jgi:diaminopimelate epimerase
MRLLARDGADYSFEMNMGRAEIRDLRCPLDLHGGTRTAALVWVGNPQCVFPVENFEFDWRAVGAAVERHARFPNRTNVSFVRAVDEHSIEVRFWERGAGETMSSGTGATGAAAIAAALGMARSPVRVLTPAGPLDLRLEDEIFLTGPARIVAQGEFLL